MSKLPKNSPDYIAGLMVFFACIAVFGLTLKSMSEH